MVETPSRMPQEMVKFHPCPKVQNGLLWKLISPFSDFCCVSLAVLVWRTADKEATSIGCWPNRATLIRNHRIPVRLRSRWWQARTSSAESEAWSLDGTPC